MSGEKTAGGMSYQTGEGIDYTIISHIFAHDEDSSREISRRNKEYYLASAGKTMARLILAETRINQVKMPEKDSNLLEKKIYDGINWLKHLIKDIQNANDLEFLNGVDYKKWHTIKLIPGHTEGYAASIVLEEELELQGVSNKNGLKEANLHNEKAKELFMKLLSSDSNTDFKLAEKQRLKAYEELKFVYKSLY